MIAPAPLGDVPLISRAALCEQEPVIRCTHCKMCMFQLVPITPAHKGTQRQMHLGYHTHHQHQILLTLEAALLTIVSLGMLYGKALKPNVVKVTLAPSGAYFFT